MPVQAHARTHTHTHTAPSLALATRCAMLTLLTCRCVDRGGGSLLLTGQVQPLLSAVQHRPEHLPAPSCHDNPLGHDQQQEVLHQRGHHHAADYTHTT